MKMTGTGGRVFGGGKTWQSRSSAEALVGRGGTANRAGVLGRSWPVEVRASAPGRTDSSWKACTTCGGGAGTVSHDKRREQPARAAPDTHHD